ncbi:hypothetical protein Glove_68g13 [Diversispora epigaea]|uniref:Uncharacterized protein n=1 Tax=Diversispora epigaea TaxID=1348612 RepID=A0A397JDP3_9GLOM|nr:hypothetical protein Glove_68g13 [Diversispora epigaea]
MDTPYLKSYYRRGSTSLTSEQIETIRMLKGKVPKYRIIREFHINENRVNDIWENHERQQQVIQSTISSEISSVSSTLPENSNQIESEVLLQSKSLGGELGIRGSASSFNHDSSNLHLESITLPNKETKNMCLNTSSAIKSRSKHVRILDQPSINKNLTGKLGGISLETKKIILPEISQETEDPLELFKRTQKDAKKSRADARADIFKQSTPKV